MCRFTFYLGKPLTLAALLTEPAHSLINQSYNAKEREEPLNGDGFGVAWYVDDHASPARFRSVTPAWSNANLADLARVTQSCCILAHVRAATQGREINENNCHPFRCGPFSFMHNGNIDGFDRLRRPLMERLSDAGFASVRGTTDSEHFFALLMERLRGKEGRTTCADLADALESTIAEVLDLTARHAPGSHNYLNMVLCDGRSAATCRFSSDDDYVDTLYLNVGRRYACEQGTCRMLDPAAGESSVLISSEPLSTDPGWELIPANHVVHISPDHSVHRRALR